MSFLGWSTATKPVRMRRMRAPMRHSGASTMLFLYYTDGTQVFYSADPAIQYT